MKINKKSLILSIMLWPISTLALQADYQQLISVSSVSQHAKMKSNTTIFSKDVLLTQGTIKITADKLTVIRGELPNHEIMIADGKVATFYQMQDDGKPFEAEAEKIHYDVAKSQITLSGNAQIKQLDSQINGSKITYFLETEELLVESEKGSAQRVKTVFLPAQFEKNNDKKSPAIQVKPKQQAEDK